MNEGHFFVVHVGSWRKEEREHSRRVVHWRRMKGGGSVASTKLAEVCSTFLP